MKYDIFISYRRDGGAQYARILQLMLIQRGYKVFLDYDELRDGTFSDRIKSAIKDAPVFMPILSAGSMKRCANDGDWVRKEILLAVQEGKPIVPINPDRTFDGVPEEAPDVLRNAIEGNQHSEISFGQLLGASIDQMIADRLVDKVGKRMPLDKKDADVDAAQETLRKIDRHNKFMKRLCIAGIAAIMIIVVAACALYWQHIRNSESLTEMRTEIETRHNNLMLQLNPDLTEQQMTAIDNMLTNMSEVYPDSIWMSQFEFTIGLWHGIKGEAYDEAQKNIPVTSKSYADIYMFLSEISDMTNLNIELPSAEVWSYAAHGGENAEATKYVGNDDVEKVAWYKDNSGGKAHPSDGQQGKEPNMLDLYDMSGNVSELCNTPFEDSGLYTVCGGNYDSPAPEVTADARKGFATDAKDEHVGFRIMIRKP